MKNIIKIAITPGEPAGIGPDLAIQADSGLPGVELIIIADQNMLQQRAKYLDKQYSISNEIQILHVPVNAPVIPGKLNPANAEYVLRTLAIACDGCMQGQFDAVVTGPVHKGILNQAGFKFTGHTEWLANRCGGNPVMMLATEGLRVALVTTHIPLAQVSNDITKEKLDAVIRTLYQDLCQRFGISKPKILVCGLNPHAGEDGYLGHEEIEIIEPVLKNLRAEGLNLIGPLPADSLFTLKKLAQTDAVLAMYHDQGLPVLKHIGFGRSANITLGLPIIRVSVDHGTALDLAGTGQASIGSFMYALETALQLCQHLHFIRKNCH